MKRWRGHFWGNVVQVKHILDVKRDFVFWGSCWLLAPEVPCEGLTSQSCLLSLVLPLQSMQESRAAMRLSL